MLKSEGQSINRAAYSAKEFVALYLDKQLYFAWGMVVQWRRM